VKGLEALALHRPELRAWALYDWANSVFMTTVLQVFPIYFVTVAARDLPGPAAAGRFALATTLAMAIVAVLAPILGALADHAGLKKRMLGVFLAIGASATAGLALVGPGDWLLGAILFILGNIGATGSIVFAESLLPHVARSEELDRLTTSAFALGYVSGGLMLALNLAWIQWPQRFGLSSPAAATRLSFLVAALWWVVFSIPLLRQVPEPKVAADGLRGSLLSAAFGRLGGTLHSLRSYRHAFLMLVAFMIYNDGINTIIRMGTVFGTELGIPQAKLIGAVLVLQFVGVPSSVLFGALARRIGARRAILLALAVYGAITLLAYRMHSAADFMLIAVLVGLVQGGAQALSRSLFASLVPRARSAEFFGFFGVFDKFAGVFGPALFALMIALTGGGRAAIASLVAFFAIGALLPARLDVAAGQAAAAAADRAFETAAAQPTN
jgi:MFS transporter, UMF1 family